MSDDPNVEVARQQSGSTSRNMQRLSEAKASLKIDTRKLDELKRGLNEVAGVVSQLRKDMEGLAAASQGVRVPSAGGGSGGGNYVKGFPSTLTGSNAVQQRETATVAASSWSNNLIGNMGGRLGSVASNVLNRSPRVAGVVDNFLTGNYTPLGGVQKAGIGAAMSAAESAGGRINSAFRAVADATNARIERGITNATSADRMNVLMQQMYGMSQVDVIRKMRMPVTDYRIGGLEQVNAMMQFQTQTGFSANAQMASSIAGIRAQMGYSRSTTDILNQQMQLMNPAVANRMLYMTGTAAYNIGGGMRDPLQMRQELIQNLGLSNANVLKGALAPGSVTRARMADAGIGEEMQTEILQMAQQQVSFRQRGGRGTYDPTKKADRELMGIESNLATQQEETDRVKTNREERFMERQIDNMATREKIDRQLIRVLGALEDTLSGIIGKDVSHGKLIRPAVGKVASGMGGLMKTAGMGLAGLAALGLSPFTGGASIGIAAGLMFGGSTLAGMGDGEGGGGAGGSASMPATTNYDDSSKDSQIMVPSGGRGSKRTTLANLKMRPDVARMDSDLKRRIFRMMRANPNVGITSGYRSYDEQVELFHAKMSPVTAEEAKNYPADQVTEFEGQLYAQTGDAFVAAPGRSMHNLGYAADIFEEGDNRTYNWIVANSAKFGLNNWRAKGWRDDEPWHVQSDNVPRTYNEAVNAGYKATVGDTAPAIPGVDSDGDNGVYGSGGSSAGASAMNYVDNSGMSSQEIIDAQKARNAAKLGGGSSSQGAASNSPSHTNAGASNRSNAKPTAKQKLDGAAVARAAYAAGFRGEALETAVAIAWRESRWYADAHAPYSSAVENAKGDRGLWQINHAAWDEILAREGIISENSPEGRAELFDPMVNARAAFYISRQGSSFGSWSAGPGGFDPNGDPMYGTLGAAETKDTVAKAFEFMTPVGTGPTAGGVGDATSRSMRIPQRGASPSGGGGSSSYTVNNSPTIHVAPVINFSGMPATPDLRNIAQTVSRMIEDEVSMLELRNA